MVHRVVASSSKWLVFLALTACTGGDPNDSAVDVDTDGDGLTDATEAELGTNPEVADSDGDGYTDFEEHDAESDPLDPASVIYTGGWPYNTNKDEIEDPGWESTPAIGTRLPRYVALDQHGEAVDLYDYAGHGKKVMLDIATQWCTPCKALAAYLSDGDTDHLLWDYDGDGEYTLYPWWREDFGALYEMVQNEEILWVTLLYTPSTSTAEPAQVEDAQAWDEAYPNEKVAVLVDTDLTLTDYLMVDSIPHLELLNSDMTLMTFSGEESGSGYPLQVFQTLFAEEE